MKFVAAMLSMLAAPLTGGSGRAMLRLGGIFAGAVVLFSAGFHVLMALEGREFTWVASVYWTLVTMTTLGFGDIVFASDLGRMYSVVVLLTGALLLLVLLPFTFVQLVYLPWRAAVRAARTPRALPEDTAGHILLTGRGPMEEALIHRATVARVPYFVIVEDIDEAATLYDQGYPVMVGDLDDPATYRAARAESAVMVLTAASDQTNTNVAFTVREVTAAGVLVATASSPDSVDVLHLAGADCVIELGDMLGRALARRILAPTARSSAISTVEDIVIAETSAAGTALVGRTLGDLDLQRRFGVSVVGLWDRGSLQPATPELRIAETSILLLAAAEERLQAYDAAFARSEDPEAGPGEAGVVILGGGRVGRAVARTLAAEGIEHRIVERHEQRVRHLDGVVIGDAADLDVLRQAGIGEASAVVVTTHDDDMNIYLTLYCRRLRAKAMILGRVALERNVTTMHRAGADFVLSYASMGATEAWNAIRDASTVLLAEGLVVFRVAVPPELAGRPLQAADIPGATGCSIVGIVRGGTGTTAFDPAAPLPADGELLLVGDEHAEERFLERYRRRRSGPPSWLRGVFAVLSTIRGSP
ncbi:MAG: NAD-binding protein [Egibacteraceae bacterium]